jgi:hypothetical protein
MPAKKPTRKAGKRDEAAARYAELKAKWEARYKDPNYAGGGDWLVDMAELPLDATPFLRTLRVLGSPTQDRRFEELHRWIMRSNLYDRGTGHWSRYGTTLANPVAWEMCETIENRIASGFTERLAIAEVVAELALGEHSFDAACQSVKRLVNAYRKFVGQQPA